MERPMPPPECIESLGPWFGKSEDLSIWSIRSFLSEDSPLHNPDHEHLKAAYVGFLWTNVSNSKKGRTVIGTAEPGQPQGAMGKWSRARAEIQVNEWFGAVPDFIITIDAMWWVDASDAEACALVEHELYHCAQDVDEFGSPKFSKQTGRPVFAIRGHDVEEFIGVVRRYGADAANVRAFVDAANAGPQIAHADISKCCGTCMRG